MSTAEETRKEAIRESVSQFLRANFPQIKMHGGQAAITAVDLDDQRVHLQLGGYCHGCGLSPMTSQAIRSRLPAQVEGVESVSVETGELPEGRV